MKRAEEVTSTKPASRLPVDVHDDDEVGKENAAEVVLAYRAIEWEAVEQGDVEAVATLQAACTRDEETRAMLSSLESDTAARLLDGLDRFHAAEVSTYMRRPSVLQGIALGSRNTAAEAAEAMAPRHRPSVTLGHTVRMNTGCGNLYVTINETEEGEPFELFNHMGKAGGCAASQNEAIGRLISYALRCGAEIDPLVKQLKGISCHRPAWGEDGKISSCADAIGKALEKYVVDREAHQAVRDAAGASVVNEAAAAPVPARRIVSESTMQGACVECGSQLAFEEGCVKCHSCGFTECG